MALLENDTLRLRAPEPEDLDLLYRWENNPDLWKTGCTMTPYSRYTLKRYIEESYRDIFATGQLRLMIELRKTGETVGTIDLYDFEPRHLRAGVGILLDPLYQGKGFATEALQVLTDYAFRFLKLHQLFVHIPEGNEASKALFTRCGFTPSGKLQDWILTEEGYSDVLVMQKIQR